MKIGGTGKTYLYNGIAAYYRAQGKVVICVATSGIAAVLLDGGQQLILSLRFPYILLQNQPVE